MQKENKEKGTEANYSNIALLIVHPSKRTIFD